MAVTRWTTFPNIVRNSRILGGTPVVKGTRIPVWCIVLYWRMFGDYERMLQAFPALDIPKMQEALAFYEANREEIDQTIRENEGEADSAD